MQNKKYFFFWLRFSIVACLLFIYQSVDVYAADCCKFTSTNCSACSGSNCDPCVFGSTMQDKGECCDTGKISCADPSCAASGPVGDQAWCCPDGSQCSVIDTNGACNGTVIPQHAKCSTISTCPQYVAGGTTGTTTTAVSFVNPITSTSIKDVLGTLLDALKNLVVTLSLIFIVLGGILYMMSAGDPSMIKRAKDCWLFSVIGLAIVVAAPTFLKEVLAILGGTLTGDGIDAALTTYQIATNVLNFLLSLVGIVAIISLVVSGGMYMTAYGDDKQTTTAKSIGKWAIIGIAIALGSLVVVQQVSKLIKG